MHFIHTGSPTSGQSYSPAFLQGVSSSEKSSLSVIPVFSVSINNSNPSNTRLETKWEYRIIYKGDILFDFESRMDYYINESKVAPFNEQLDDIILETYQRLVKEFNIRRKEFALFDEISPFDAEILEVYRQRLYASLLPVIESSQ